MKNEDILRLEALCLRHPGVGIIGFVDKPRGVIPEKAWGHVIKMASKPSIVFSDDHLLDAQDAWWRFARSNGLLSEHDTCLLSVGGLGQLPWARLRLPGSAPVLEIFALDKGSPEFIVMSESGSRLLAATSEEDETWLYLVDCQGSQLRTVLPDDQ